MSVKYFCAQILSLSIFTIQSYKIQELDHTQMNDWYKSIILISSEIICICTLIKIFLGKLHNHKYGWLLDHKKSIQRNSTLMSHAERRSNSIREKQNKPYQKSLEISNFLKTNKNLLCYTFSFLIRLSFCFRSKCFHKLPLPPPS